MRKDFLFDIILKLVLVFTGLCIQSCTTPKALLPPIPVADEKTVPVIPPTTKEETEAPAPLPRRPAGNDPGDLAQFALKGDYEGLDSTQKNCKISVKGWGNDGSALLKEYHEFVVTGYDKMIRTQFWPVSVERTKNDFKSKFTLFGNRFITLHKKDDKQQKVMSENKTTDPERVALTVYLDDDQQTILGYNLITQINKERKQTRCVMKPASVE